MSTCSCAVRVTIFSIGGKFQPISNFMQLHILTLAALFLFALARKHTERWPRSQALETMEVPGYEEGE